MSNNPFKYTLDEVVKVTLGYEVVSAKVTGFYIHPTTKHPRYIVEYLEGSLTGTQEEHYEDTLNVHLIKQLAEYPQAHNPYSPNNLVKSAFNP